MKKIVCLLLCCTVGVCCADNPLARIIAGNDADIKDYPYMVQLKRLHHTKPPSYFCSGSIIDKTHILSAAHCLSYDSEEQKKRLLRRIRIHASTSRRDVKGNVFEVKDIIIHPEYNASSHHKNDIAILKLTEEIEFSDTQKPIELPTHNIKNGSVGVLTGWGDTKGFHMHSPANVLQKLTLDVVDYKDCRGHRGHVVPFLIDTQICAYSPDKTKHDVDGQELERSACSGDSGAPLVVDKKVVGTVSFGLEQHCGSGDPTVYTNVYKFLDFIEKNTEN